MIWVGITYNFNSIKQQKGHKKQEDDRSRLNLGLSIVLWGQAPPVF